MNYWEIAKDDLPSKCLTYPANFRLEIRPLSVGNLKYLTTMSPENAFHMLNGVLRSCTKIEGIDFEDLKLIDRLYLLLWIRANSFMNSNGYKLNITCPYCGKRIEKIIRLEDLDMKELNHAALERCFEVDGNVYRAWLPTIRDGYLFSEDREISLILNYTNVREYIPITYNAGYWVSQLDAMTYSKLLSLAKSVQCGVDSTYIMQCEDCYKDLHIDIGISDDNMFGKINLIDILKVQLQISKYCGFQLSDDTPYTEVEIDIEIVKEMQKAENEQMEKEKSSMNTSMPNIGALKSGMSMPSMPAIHH